MVMAGNTPVQTRLIKKYLSGYIDLPIMFVLISNSTQPLVNLCLKIQCFFSKRNKYVCMQQRHCVQNKCTQLAFQQNVIVVEGQKIEFHWWKSLISCFYNNFFCFVFRLRQPKRSPSSDYFCFQQRQVKTQTELLQQF